MSKRNSTKAENGHSAADSQPVAADSQPVAAGHEVCTRQEGGWLAWRYRPRA
jgi:hypothetical protein